MSCPRRASWLFALAATGACFDSDESFKSAQSSTTTGGGSTGFVTTSTGSTTGLDSTTVAPDKTCRDAIHCVRDCAAFIIAQLIQDPNYEADLSCFLDCEEELTVPEATKLLRLGNCCSERCADLMECDPPAASTGGSTGTGTGGGTSTGGGGEEPPLLDPCIACIFACMDDPEPPTCEQLANTCQ